MIYQIKSKILENKRIVEDYFKIVLFGPSRISKLAKPGQFLHIRVADGYEPLLRRPFSIHRISKCQMPNGKWQDVIEVLYEVVGKGTKILSEKKTGEYLDILGSLGNGFNLTPRISNLKPILVAGGIGVAPLLFLADYLSTYKLTNLSTILIGAKTKKKLLCEKEFKDLGCNLKVSTEDGSKGYKGRVTDLLKNQLSTINYKLSTIYACGPKEMLKEVTETSKKYKIPAFGSLEENIGCGMGVCLGCVIKTRDGYRRVCKDGPVFDLNEIIW